MPNRKFFTKYVGLVPLGLTVFNTIPPEEVDAYLRAIDLARSACFGDVSAAEEAAVYGAWRAAQHAYLVDEANARSLSAAGDALLAHKGTLQIEGDAVTQVYHLIASLFEWCAVEGIDFEATLSEVRGEIASGQLGLPVAQAALRRIEHAREVASRASRGAA